MNLSLSYSYVFTSGSLTWTTSKLQPLEIISTKKFTQLIFQQL